MAKKNLGLKRISKRIGVDPDKLDDYMLFLNDELLFEPDYDNPNAPCLTSIVLKSLDCINSVE